MTNRAYFPLRRGLEDFLERKFHMAMIAANTLVLTTAYSQWKIFHRPHCCRKDKVVIILCIVISLFMNCPKYFVLVCIVICKFYFHRKDRYVKHCFNYIPNWSHTVLKVWPKWSSTSSTMNQGNNYNGFRKAYCCRFYMLVV